MSQKIEDGYIIPEVEALLNSSNYDVFQVREVENFFARNFNPVVTNIENQRKQKEMMLLTGGHITISDIEMSELALSLTGNRGNAPL